LNDKRKGIERRKTLRRQAESLVISLSPSKTNAQATEILTHELLVHKVELEMQNEELQRVNASMEEARDRYLDFYEFAPVGYITLNRDGLITEINLTGSVLLGVERFRLISRRLSNYVNHLDKDRWYRIFMQIMEHRETEKKAFDLEMIRADGTTFYAYLNCVKRQISDSPTELRMALTDISNLKKAAT
jgi:PAS domain S-box-containing protein